MTHARRTKLGFTLVVLLALAAPARAGGLSFLGLVRDGAAGVDGLAGGLALALSPDGAHVYVAGADDDAVAVFARNPSTGLLTYVAVARNGTGGIDGMRVPDAVAVSPDGAHVYVTSREEDALLVFARDGTAGTLTFVEVLRDGVAGVDGIDHASGVAVSPDGGNVYATGEHDDAVAVFTRNAATGALTFVEVHRDGVGGVAGIDRPSAVTLSGDGANVYVAGGAADGVGVFARAALTGALTFVETERYGDGHGVDRPSSLAVTSDGASLYVAGHDDDGVAAFTRDLPGGGLTFVEIERDHGFLGGLAGAFAVASSPDGRYVFAAGENDHTVATLRRDPATSALVFVEAQRDGRFGVDGLRRASAVAVSPDGAHLYAIGHDDDAVATFAVDRCGNGTLGTDESCDDGNLVAGDGCAATCRLEACPPTPAGGCRRPTQVGAAALSVTHQERALRHALSWRWTKGEATPRADFGLPTATAGSVLCVYDGAAVPQPRLALAAPAAGDCAGVACWNASRTGYAYKDRLWTPDGLSLVRLHEGLTDGTAKLIVAGRGANLDLPPLPFTTPVQVQLVNTETGVCWEATYSAPTVNDAERFKSTSD